MPGPGTASVENSALLNEVDEMFDELKKKKKKEKKNPTVLYGGEAMESLEPSSPPSQKKTKKKSKEKVLFEDPSPALDKSASKSKKSKKRKPDEPLDSEPELKVSKVEQSESEESSEVINPYAVSNFRISEALRRKLKTKGIEALFPIQALTFNAIFKGNDLVGRARTGQGKTLAFVLPILESLSLDVNFKRLHGQYGRAPSVLVLVPTRELAKQVHGDFEFYGEAIGLKTVCVYGGAPYGPQQNAMRRGVDVVVGTPGRIKDLLQRDGLNLKTIKFRVLDEADEMLNMGFVDDVELILGHVEDAANVQTLLFSATMPEWVKKIASKFLKDVKETVDLVGEEKMKASCSVRHLLLPCGRAARAQLIPDVISCYSSGGRTIIFTETKNDASELGSSLPSSRVLHGDIAQAQREVTLAGFRSGKFPVLVATDVAARGLDINDVQLIIQCEPSRDVETYIHRSGRTGRAGKTGVSVLFYDRMKEYMIPTIERKAGFKFERVSAPHPAEIARSACASASEKVVQVSDSVLPIFRPAVDVLLQNSDLSAADLLAKALARIAGLTDVKKRSLLTSQSDFTTVILQSERPFYTPSYAFSSLKRLLPEDVVEKVKGMSLTMDGLGAVFDVPSDLLNSFLSAKATDLSITQLDSLPELQARQERSSSFGRRGGYGGGGGRASGSHARFGRGSSQHQGRQSRRGSFGGGGFRRGR
ncbi:hypothetical protein GOP47_0014775 [Adiantum capillus-veneris]|uniref:RNA helicase n=1 Tax=Adiantum capillus-veneris TaxID=13818 RepID=A0A9D4ZDT7_ADICA|nr:hypothetical protein GOP47_0014775 [Adiantum capillus-veneris]